MKDPALDIRTAYYNALTGKILLGGVALPVYDTRVPQDSKAANYIVLSSQNMTSVLGTKSDFVTDNAILIEIVTKFPGTSGGGFKTVDQLSNQVCQIINPSDKTKRISFGTDFQNIFCEIIGINQLHESGTEEVFRKFIRALNKVHQR